MIRVLALLPLANDLVTVTATKDLEEELVNKLVNSVLENMFSEMTMDYKYFSQTVQQHLASTWTYFRSGATVYTFLARSSRSQK